jgi:hypothetical protein
LAHLAAGVLLAWRLPQPPRPRLGLRYEPPRADDLLITGGRSRLSAGSHTTGDLAGFAPVPEQAGDNRASASASPATGFMGCHLAEQDRLVHEALGQKKESKQ